MKIKLNETNSVWNYFGVLADVSETSTMPIIRSDDGQERKMSKRKYKLAAENVKQKALSLVGLEVEVRTSQATKTWNENTWFSSIKEFA